MKSRFSRGLFFSIAAIAGATLVPIAASAQFFDLHCTGVGLGEDVSISIPNNTNWNVYAGQIEYQLTPATPNAPASPTFSTYCVDLTHDVSIGDTYLITPQSTNVGLTNGGEIAYLDNQFGSSITDSTHAAALQVAIWKLLSDPTNTSLTEGNFILNSTGAVATDAEVYLQDALGKSGNAIWADASLDGAVSNHEQSQLLPTNQVTVVGAATPEPGVTALACAVPTAGLVLLGRRRCRRNR